MIVYPVKIFGELGKVVHFDVIPRGTLQTAARSTPSVVVGSSESVLACKLHIALDSTILPIVDLIFLFLRDRQLEEIFGDRELFINKLLVNSKIFDVEESKALLGQWQSGCQVKLLTQHDGQHAQAVLLISLCLQADHNLRDPT